MKARSVSMVTGERRSCKQIPVVIASVGRSASPSPTTCVRLAPAKGRVGATGDLGRMKVDGNPDGDIIGGDVVLDVPGSCNRNRRPIICGLRDVPPPPVEYHPSKSGASGELSPDAEASEAENNPR
jgi:hypothetical protein